MGYYSEAIARHIVTHVASEGKEAYQKFFKSALEKFNAKSINDLDDDKKKEFFNHIEKNYTAKNESQKLKDNDPVNYQVMSNQIHRAFKKAGIKVIKDKPMKHGMGSNISYACFYTVKAANGNDIIPVYVDKKGNVELGVSSEGFIIGKINDMNKMVKNLKDFKKSDLDESIREATDPELDKGYDDLHDALVNVDKMLKKKDRRAHAKFKKWWNQLDEFFPGIDEGKNNGLWANIHAKRKRGEKPAKSGDKDYPKTLDIEAATGFSKSKFYKKLNTLQKKAVDIAFIMGGNMTGAIDAIEKLKKGLSKDKTVAGVLRLANESVNETSVSINKDQMAKLHNDKEIVLTDPDGKEHKITFEESTPLQVKTSAYTDVLHALDKYATILNKVGSKKKSKFASQMIKNLQKDFFAKEGFGEIKGGVEGDHVKGELDQIKFQLGQLLTLAIDPNISSDIFNKIKPSQKALRAAVKLLNKVN